MSDTADLAHMDDAALSRLYAERIEPLLKGFEEPRLKAMAEYRRRMSIGMPGALVLGIGVLALFREPFAALVVGGLAALAAWGIARMPLEKLARQVKASMLGEIAATVDVAYQETIEGDPLVARGRRLNILPSHDRSRYEDWFHGERQGCRFDLFEAHLEDERRDDDGDTTWVTVFRGQIIRIAFPKSFEGVTVVRRDSGVFNAIVSLGARMDGRKLERVGLVDPHFEKIFEVYSTDQTEARYLVHPVFIERLVEVEAAFSGKRVRCAFEEGDLLVAVEGGNRFEAGDMTKPLAEEARAREVIEDVRRILKLMDAVLTAETAPLLKG
jgi:hypothetical protein